MTSARETLGVEKGNEKVGMFQRVERRGWVDGDVPGGSQKNVCLIL